MMRFSRTVAGAAAILALLVFGAADAPVAAASTSQEATFQDDALLRADPAGTLDRLRQLGVTRVRVFVTWSSIAPDPLSTRRPRHFVASDPASYPAAKWALWDTIVRAAATRSIGLDMVLTGGAPLWATGRDAPPPRRLRSQWKPSAREFGQFVRAIGERYSGDYDPEARKLDPASANDLPPVDYWAIWNEPDYGPVAGPPGHSRFDRRVRRPPVPRSARRRLERASGHRSWLRHDPVRRACAARLEQLRALLRAPSHCAFCAPCTAWTRHYRPLRGLPAALRGCPASAAGRRGFRRAHPALFNASGISDHPYSQASPPNVEASPDRDFTSLAELSQLERSVDRLQRAYGSAARMPVFLTEYGYITSPPKHSTRKRRYIPAAIAAGYINWAEYLAWRDPRVMTVSQYLLLDPVRPNAGNDYGGFASGLLLHNGSHKATYDAYRMPIYLPRTRTHGSGRRLEIWGAARPAGFAFDDTSADQTRGDPVPALFPGAVRDPRHGADHQRLRLLRRPPAAALERLGAIGVELSARR